MSGTKLNADGRLGIMLTELRLPTIKRLATDLCDQSDLEGWPARQLLERLLEQEMSEREMRRFERHRVASGLSPDKRLSSFDFSAVPTVSRARIMALTEGHEWLDRGACLLAFGAPGSGKSHLLSGIGHALIDAGRRVLFTRCTDLVQRLQAARRDLRLPQELAKLDRFDLVILDDLSYVRRDQAETSVLFELISERYERKSIAITANTPFSQWGDVFVRSSHDARCDRSTRPPCDDPRDERRQLSPAHCAGKADASDCRQKIKNPPAVDSVDELHKHQVVPSEGLIHPAHSTTAAATSSKKGRRTEGERYLRFRKRRPVPLPAPQRPG
ncbi:MAG: IS21-like element helper ATPase IstB [Candidatus Cybelea sp.]